MTGFQSMLVAGAGGFLGTCLRFWVGRWTQWAFGAIFPWGTFAVNLIGSFLIGLLFGCAERNQLISTSLNLLLITGFCGGFTTFSSFSNDMFLLLQQRQWLLFGLYVGLSFVLGLLLVYAGRWLTMRF